MDKKQIGVATNGRSFQAAASEIEAKIRSVIQQASIKEDDRRGRIAMKLMRALRVQVKGFPIIEALPNPDNLDDIIFQIVICGKTDVINLDTARIIEIALTPAN
jgi:hypothetical protein